MHSRDIIYDVITGQPLTGTLEEQAVQLMARWLLSVGYRKEQIQTHPQYRIKSGEKERWPVDIAVFRDSSRDTCPILIVECKREASGVGLDQLRKYLERSGARVGIWFDGTHLTHIFHTRNAVDFFRGVSKGAPSVNQTFGPYLRGLRESRNRKDPSFSVRQVASRIGVNPTYLSKVERGESLPPSDELLEKLARDLGEDESEMFARAGRVAPKMRSIITARPDVFAELVGTLADLPEAALHEVARRVRDGKW